MDATTISSLQQAVIRETEQAAYFVNRRMDSEFPTEFNGPWLWHERFFEHKHHSKPNKDNIEVSELFLQHQVQYPELYWGTRCGNNYEDEHDVGHLDPCVCERKKFRTWHLHEWIFAIITLIHDVDDPEWPRRAFGAFEGYGVMARMLDYQYWMSQRSFGWIGEDEIIATIKENRTYGWTYEGWIRKINARFARCQSGL